MRFHVHNPDAGCKVHVRHTLNEKKESHMCEAYSYSKLNTKLFTRKELIMETSIVEFCQFFDIPEIQKLALSLAAHTHF